MAVEYATVGLYACSFLPCLSNLSSVILHMLHKLRLRCLNGKKAIAAIPSETVLEYKWIEDM